eukprot:10108812-Alexandrium_andersonii.AAC.1
MGEPQGDQGRYVPISDLSRYAAPHRVDEACVQEALTLWEGLGCVERNALGDVRVCRPAGAPATQPVGGPPLSPPGPAPGATTSTPLVLLSLFDGVGTARLAVERILQVAGCSEALVASWFCEAQRPLAAAVAASRALRSQRVGVCPHRLATHDVWDL